MTSFENFDQLEEQVSAQDNILSVQMSALRDLQGAGRLGPYVVEQISNELAKRGLGHYPSELPQVQWEFVRIFKLGTTVAELIHAAMNIGDREDKKLRDLSSNDAAEKLKQIRLVVC